MENLETWLTVEQAAPIVQMSKQALYAAIRERQLPAIHIGRRVRIDPMVLTEWAKNGGGTDSLAEGGA